MESMQLESRDPAGLGRILPAMFTQDALIVEKTLKTQCTLLTSLVLTSLPAWEWWGGSGFPDCQAQLPLAQGPSLCWAWVQEWEDHGPPGDISRGAPGSQIEVFPLQSGNVYGLCMYVCGHVCVHICASLDVHTCVCMHHFWGRVGEFRR